MSDDQKTYVVSARCINCRWQGVVTVRKGVPVVGHPCPNCGCAHTLLPASP